MCIYLKEYFITIKVLPILGSSNIFMMPTLEIFSCTIADNIPLRGTTHKSKAKNIYSMDEPVFLVLQSLSFIYKTNIAI